VIFPRTYEKIKNTLKEFTPILVKGVINTRNEEKSLMVDEILDVEKVRLIKEISVSICDETSEKAIAEFKEILNKNPGNNIIKIYYGDKNAGKFILKKVSLSQELNDFIQKYRC